MENSWNTQSDSFLSFLHSLKGKTVTVYKGGPESKTGKLLDVQNDYLTISFENNNNNSNQQNSAQETQQNNGQNNRVSSVIYYNSRHVKSIGEDSKANSVQSIEEENQEKLEFFTANTFAELASRLTNSKIQLNQGGPEARQGMLLGIENDFLVLFTEEDGLVYVNLHHVKSISQINNLNEEQTPKHQETSPVYPEALSASSFQNVFIQLVHKWVSINRKGPEAMEGVLLEISDGYYTLVNGSEIHRVNPFHIKSISVGAKGSFQNLMKNKQNQDGNAEEAAAQFTDVNLENKIANNNSKEEPKKKEAEKSSNNEKSNEMKQDKKKDEKQNKKEDKKEGKKEDKKEDKKEGKKEDKKEDKKEGKKEDKKEGKKEGKKKDKKKGKKDK